MLFLKFLRQVLAAYSGYLEIISKMTFKLLLEKLSAKKFSDTDLKTTVKGI